MAAFVALLRAVNVGGHNKVGMADLRSFCTRLEFGNPRTLLQSGNLVFEAGKIAAASLERRLEEGARKHLGLDVDFMVRTAPEWKALVAGNPFPKAAKDDPGRLVVMCLKAAPKDAEVKALREAITGRETIEVAGRHAYIIYPDGMGTSRFSSALIERRLGTRGTARNWNTVLKLAELLG